MKKRFPKAWLEQGFHFSKCSDLGFGLVQNDGGPCGPMAVVQAFVLDYLLFHEKKKISKWQNPTEIERSTALRYEISTILWQAGTSRGCCVVVTEKKMSKSKKLGIFFL